MANQAHLARLKEGVGSWNEWRQNNPGVEIDLSGADLGGADVVAVNFSGANLCAVHLNSAHLHHANLTNARLSTAILCGADLSAANLDGATLTGANLSAVDLNNANIRHVRLPHALLSYAKLQRADFAYADFTYANLSHADLSHASLTRAILGGTIFGNTNLCAITGLDSCEHVGFSMIDQITLAKSGALPLPFLRGCGLPESLITYLPSLFNDAIQFYSCFISYSTKDQEFAERLHADLQNKGVRCWFAPHHIKGGKKLHQQIDEAIRVYDRLLLILSENSMTSEWVKTEIANARQRELNEKRQMLFPISLAPFESVRQWKAFDADTGKDSAREIREYFIPDFSNWKDHDSYKVAFDRLLRDLAAKDLSASA
jgi:uncharacterized protein YjbI with pentapeptide repeats